MKGRDRKERERNEWKKENIGLGRNTETKIKNEIPRKVRKGNEGIWKEIHCEDYRKQAGCGKCGKLEDAEYIPSESGGESHLVSIKGLVLEGPVTTGVGRICKIRVCFRWWEMWRQGSCYRVEQTVITALHLSHSRCCPESDEYHNRPLRKLHPRSLVNIMLPVSDACGNYLALVNWIPVRW